MSTGLRYPGKVVIVTDVTTGIGLAVVKEFVRQGACVVFCSREPGAQKGHAIERELQSSGLPGNAFYQVCDVRKESDIKRLIQVTIEHYGCLDCVVNNAENTYIGSTDDLSAQDFMNVMEVNVVSALLVSKYALPYLRKSKGNIINLGRLYGEIGLKDAVAAVASKGAVIALTKALAIDESKYGVRVNSIAPGHITTVWGRITPLYKNPEAVLHELESFQLMGRLGTPEEVALGVLFLAADATFSTGLNLVLSGGAELGFGVKSYMATEHSASGTGNLLASSSH